MVQSQNISGIILLMILFVTSCKYKDTNEILTENMDQAQKIIDSVHQYEDDNGIPPVMLHALLPQYLTEIPQTTMGDNYHFGVKDSDDWFISFYVENRETGCVYSSTFEFWDCSFAGAGKH